MAPGLGTFEWFKEQSRQRLTRRRTQADFVNLQVLEETELHALDLIWMLNESHHLMNQRQFFAKFWLNFADSSVRKLVPRNNATLPLCQELDKEKTRRVSAYIEKKCANVLSPDMWEQAASDHGSKVISIGMMTNNANGCPINGVGVNQGEIVKLLYGLCLDVSSLKWDSDIQSF